MSEDITQSQYSAAHEANEKIGNIPGGTKTLSDPAIGAQILTTYEQNSALKRENVNLELENRTDHVTGLPNGRAYKEMLLGLEDKWHRLKKKDNQKSGTFIAADLTGLKKVDDDPSMGHDVGDLYLREGAKIFLGVLRASDRVCRLGDFSDEYMLHLSGPVFKKELAEIKIRINEGFADTQAEFRRTYPSIVMSVSLSSCSYNSEVNPGKAASEALRKLGDAKKKRERETGLRGEKVEVPD